jgi:hypothetical protein
MRRPPRPSRPEGAAATPGSEPLVPVTGYLLPVTSRKKERSPAGTALCPTREGTKLLGTLSLELLHLKPRYRPIRIIAINDIDVVNFGGKVP